MQYSAELYQQHDFTDHNVWSRCSSCQAASVSTTSFQAKETRTDSTWPKPCLSRGGNEGNNRRFGVASVQNIPIARPANRQQSIHCSASWPQGYTVRLLLSSLLGCVRLSTVWPDRANDIILQPRATSETWGTRNKLSVYIRPLLGEARIKSNIMAICTSFAELSEGHAKTASKPATSLQSPDVRFRVEYCICTPYGGDAKLSLRYSSSNGSSTATACQPSDSTPSFTLGCGNKKKSFVTA